MNTITPEDKATELKQKFGKATMFTPDNSGYTLSEETAAKMAIICVEEALASNNAVKTKEGKYEIHFHSIVGGVEFWQNVLEHLKKEIA